MRLGKVRNARIKEAGGERTLFLLFLFLLLLLVLLLASFYFHILFACVGVGAVLVLVHPTTFYSPISSRYRRPVDQTGRSFTAKRKGTQSVGFLNS
jgi:uncharacterized membrane protein